MIIETKEYVGTPGLNYIQDVNLFYVTILRVCRNGLGYKCRQSGTGDRTVQYSVAEGKITFDPNDLFPPGGPIQKVMVRFKH